MTKVRGEMKSTPKEQERLLSLQILDSSIGQLQYKLQNIPEAKALEVTKISFNSTRDLVIAAETELADIKHELSKSEIDVEQVTSRIERDEKRLASGTGTPKELEQLQHELQSLAKRRSELEEVELEVMVRVDAINDRIKSLGTERDQHALRISELESLVGEAKKEIENAMASGHSQRMVISQSINKELIDLYEKIRSQNGGVGAALLEGDTCEGCHLTMNAGERARVKALPEDEVVRCEECRCILVRM